MLSHEVQAGASTSEVWRWLSDVPRWAELLPTVDRVEQVGGPAAIDVGSRFKMWQPGLAAATYTVTEWEVGVGFTWEARLVGVRTTATHTIRSIGSGSHLVLGIRWAGPLAPVIRRVYGARTQAMIATEADTFARLAAEQG